MSTALVAGSTGLVGNILLQELLKDDSYTKVISIGRRKTAISNPKLEQLVVDFENLNNTFVSVDTVFCCLGTTIKKAGSKQAFSKVDHDYPLLLARYAQEQGAKSFHIITAMGANAKSSVFYNSVKGLVEDDLKELGFDQLHIYRPALLLGDRSEKRVAEIIAAKVMKAFNFLFRGLLKNYKAIEASSVARYMLKTSHANAKGIFVYLSGDMQPVNP